MNNIKVVLEYLKSDLKNKHKETIIEIKNNNNNPLIEEYYEEILNIQDFYIEKLVEDTINNLIDSELMDLILQYNNNFETVNTFKDGLEKIESFFEHSCLVFLKKYHYDFIFELTEKIEIR